MVRRVKVSRMHKSRYPRVQLGQSLTSAYYQPQGLIANLVHPLVLLNPNDSEEHYLLLDKIAVRKIEIIDARIDLILEDMEVEEMPRGIVRSAYEHNRTNWLMEMRLHARIRQQFIRRRIREQRYARGLQRRFRGRSFVGRLTRVLHRTV